MMKFNATNIAFNLFTNSIKQWMRALFLEIQIFESSRVFNHTRIQCACVVVEQNWRLVNLLYSTICDNRNFMGSLNRFHFIHGPVSIRNKRSDIKYKHIIRNRFQECMLYSRRSFCHLQIVNNFGIIVCNALFYRWVDVVCRASLWNSTHSPVILSINLNLIGKYDIQLFENCLIE